jgi:thiol-disulfide isomerase/thioredoxin
MMTLRTRRSLQLVLSVLLLRAGAAMGRGPQGEEAAKQEKEKDGPALVGNLDREQIEAAVPDWVQAEVEAQPEPAAAQALAAVEPGAEVVVFLGTWCSDSRREVPRFWKALDATGGAVSFTIRYVGVDREKKEPAAAVAGSDVRFLPTFIVQRDGRETGRIVETSPHGVEQDLLDLLTGKARGVLTTREDLTPETAAKAPG